MIYTVIYTDLLRNLLQELLLVLKILIFLGLNSLSAKKISFIGSAPGFWKTRAKINYSFELNSKPRQ